MISLYHRMISLITINDIINDNINDIIDERFKLIILDITDGEFREIDMTEPPFSLPKPIKEILDKDEQTKKSDYYCYLNLYTKDQINNIAI